MITRASRVNVPRVVAPKKGRAPCRRVICTYFTGTCQAPPRWTAQARHSHGGRHSHGQRSTRNRLWLDMPPDCFISGLGATRNGGRGPLHMYKGPGPLARVKAIQACIVLSRVRTRPGIPEPIEETGGRPAVPGFESGTSHIRSECSTSEPSLHTLERATCVSHSTIYSNTSAGKVPGLWR